MLRLSVDGYRIIAVSHGGKVRLFTRNQLDWTKRYQRIADRLTAMKLGDTTLDGELVALDAKGDASFGRMQAAGEDASIPLLYHVFDLLNDGGYYTAELDADAQTPARFQFHALPR